MNMKAFGNAIDDFDKALNFELHHTFNQKVYQSKSIYFDIKYFS